jgi:hypothetical protein
MAKLGDGWLTREMGAVLQIRIDFNVDPDTDPEPAFFVNADPDPDPEPGF